MRVPVSLRLVFVVVAVVLFVLAAFTGVWNELDMIALGLAFFAGASVVP